MPGAPAPTLNGVRKPVNMNPPGLRAPAVTAPTRKLHPLHTAEMIAQRVLNTGEYPDPERGTGRTTELALMYLSRAIRHPHTAIDVRDHHDSNASHRALVRLIHDMARALNLAFIITSESSLTITFERRQSPPANPFAGFRPLDINQPIA